jgi:hypothetical protein
MVDSVSMDGGQCKSGWWTVLTNVDGGQCLQVWIVDSVYKHEWFTV